MGTTSSTSDQYGTKPVSQDTPAGRVLLVYTMSASRPVAPIAARTRAMRASSTASGSSAFEREIRPRRMLASRRDLEQFARGLAQHLNAGLRHHDRIAEHDVADLGMIGVRMHDQRHPRRERRIHILEQVRLRIAKQTEAVAAHARPFAGSVLAQAVFAKDVVLGAGDVGGCGAGPHG